MTTSQIDSQSEVIELTNKAFEQFCNKISENFNVDINLNPIEPCVETAQGLEKKFNKLSATVFIKQENSTDNHFRMVFDKIGLFTLPGTIVMQSEKDISANIKNGSAKKAETMRDAIAEVGKRA